MGSWSDTSAAAATVEQELYAVLSWDIVVKGRCSATHTVL